MIPKIDKDSPHMAGIKIQWQVNLLKTNGEYEQEPINFGNLIMRHDALNFDDAKKKIESIIQKLKTEEGFLYYE